MKSPHTNRTNIEAPATPPGEPEGTGDRLEREPNQRPHDLDLHQTADYSGKGIKGGAEEEERLKHSH